MSYCFLAMDSVILKISYYFLAMDSCTMPRVREATFGVGDEWGFLFTNERDGLS